MCCSGGELYNMHCGERIQFSNEMLILLLIMISTSGTDGRVRSTDLGE